MEGFGRSHPSKGAPHSLPVCSLDEHNQLKIEQQFGLFPSGVLYASRESAVNERGVMGK
jgi:hypothetical protein